jgi:hypothetical protein
MSSIGLYYYLFKLNPFIMQIHTKMNTYALKQHRYKSVGVLYYYFYFIYYHANNGWLKESFRT